MRVLLRNSENGSLACMEVLSASFSDEDNELTLENSETLITVSGITRGNADAAIRMLYAEGKVDLSMYESDI